MPINGTLRATVLEARNLKIPEIASPSPFISLSTPEERVSTGVKDGTTTPSFDESFTLFNVSKETVVTVTLMNKGAKDMVVGSAKIPPSEWGTAATPTVNWYPVQTRDNKFGGEVRLSVAWSPEFVFRPPFSLMAAAAQRTLVISRKIDRPVNILVDIGNAYLWRPACNLASRVKRMPSSRSVPLGIVLAMALFAMVATALVIFVPLSILFLPITIFGAFAAAIFLFFAAPVAALVGWIVLCTPTVQRRIVQPVLLNVVGNPRAKKILLAR